MSSLVVTECKKETDKVYTLDIDRIIPNNNQPRRVFEDLGIISLADSIHRYGILQPITVRRCDDGFKIIAGERRYRAACFLRMKQIPCIILDLDEQTCHIISIIENIQKREINMFEEARGILSLKNEYGMTQEAMARTLSVSQSYIANKLRLLRFSEEEQRLIIDNCLTERHCRTLLRLEDEARIQALEHIIINKLSICGAEDYIDKLCQPKRSPSPRLNDLRVFYNSIDRAVSSAKKLGVNIATERTSDDDCERITIILSK